MFRIWERIDTENASAFEKELLAEKPSELDASDLKYISSAGLRVLLKLSKEMPDGITIDNVSPEVYEIFEVTGFTDMVNVRKRLKEVSVEGLDVIGKGSCGTVYRIDPETIIKVYDAPRHQHEPELAKIEADISREIFKRGLPTAISYNIVRCGKYFGAVYEKISGVTLEELVTKSPDSADGNMRKKAELAVQIHHTEAPADMFPDSKITKLSRGEPLVMPWLGDDGMKHWKELIDSIPDRNTMVHTDFHADNIMVQNDELILIDVGGAAHGHPVFDFVSMYLRAEMPALVKSKLPAELNKKMFDIFVHSYFGERINDGNRGILHDLFDFVGNIPITAAFCGMGVPGNCDPHIESEIRSRLDLLKKTAPETIARKFEQADRELFV